MSATNMDRRETLVQSTNGWQLSGAAVLSAADKPCRLECSITCDAE